MQNENTIGTMVRCLLLALLAPLGGCSSTEDVPVDQSQATVNESPQKPFDPQRAFAMWTNVEMGGKHVSTRIHFLDEWAVVNLDNDDESSIVILNLKTQSWYTPRTGYVNLAGAKEWADVSEKAARDSVEKGDSPPEDKQLMLATLEPNFTVTPTEAGLRLENEALRYELTGAVDVTARQLELIFTCARLYAYQKAMIERQFLPNAELALFAELERRAYLPARTQVTVRNPGVTLAVKMRTQIRPVNEREIPKIEQRIAAWKDKFPARPTKSPRLSVATPTGT
jgi:hypothetical protein